MHANANQVQNGYYPPNNVAQDSYIRSATTYYPPSGGHYDLLNNVQSTCNTNTPYMQTNTYHEHHHHFQQQQPQPQHQQLHPVNSFANEYGIGIQNIPVEMNQITNDMPMGYNNFNNFDIAPNRQDHATTNNACLMDSTYDLPNSSDISQLNRLNTAELYNAMMELNNYTTDGLASNVETQLSIE